MVKGLNIEKMKDVEDAVNLKILAEKSTSQNQPMDKMYQELIALR